MMKPVRTVLAAAVALATAPAFAQNFSQTVFFGDSLTDAGYFRPALVAANGPSAAILGRFTTNPGLVWAEEVADYYGGGAAPFNQGGTNYAIGGAMVSTDRTGLSPSTPTLSLKPQTSRSLTATGPRADSGALYTVWGGANDLFAATAAAQTSPAQAQAIVTAAVTGQVANVMTLQNAGARYILVPNVPDLGITPQYRAQGAPAMALGTSLATSYNNGLFAGLAAAGARVIPLDTFSLLREISANPAPYGITNVTNTACLPPTANSIGCNPGTYATPDAPQTYAFADGVHPTTKAHQILADYTVSILEAPGQLAVLPHSAAMVGRSRAERVGAQASSRPDVDGMRWWVDARADSQRYGGGDNYDGIGPTVSFGIDWASGDLVFGGFAGYGKQNIDWGRNRGDFDQTDASLGGYLAWSSGALWVNGQVSYTWLSYDVDRRVQLGPATRVHTGSPDGSNLSVGAAAGWNFGEGALKHGPVVSLLSQSIDVDGYAENSTEATALAFGDQTFDSLIGSIGWQVDYTASESLRPYARLTYDHEFEDGDTEAFAQLRSMPGTAPYAVPVGQYDQNYGTMTFGVRTAMFGLNADIGSSLSLDKKGGHDATLFVSVGGGF